MNIHEHQAKQILRKYGAVVPDGVFASSVEELVEKAKTLKSKKLVLKAQIHAGGRGKAGGVELIDSPDQAEAFAKKWLGQKLVTYQTDKDGQLVNSILIEECTNISKELYLSAVIDRDSQKIVFIPDVDECDPNVSNCMHNCDNTDGSYVCSCNDGFTLNGDGFSCDGERLHNI